ncbi:MAG TPA: tetratricopeptide repeat protein [Pseudonocardiaceae bacterium]|nr:tetratricopeptide repeat protein [Pseudonocardiaceae bacterium]
MSAASEHDPGDVQNELSTTGSDVVQARDVTGGIHFHGSIIPAGGIPRQLPPDIRSFVNRSDDIENLDAILAPSESDAHEFAMCVVVGTAGVGKTSLAIHWAHRVAPRFPDGQLYINLRGYDPGTPVSPQEVLDEFLRAMGVPAEAIPTSLESRSALYRSILADRRVLIVLDNASSASQIRPLMPGTSGSLVLVTSRNRLAALIARDGAYRISIDLLTPEQAVELLHTVIERYRSSDSADELAELAQLCARLPLALRIAAERAISRPQMPLRDLIADLRDESSLWDALTTEDDGESEAVRAVFSWSYRAMSKQACGLFRLLGLHPGPDFGAEAVAALAQAPVHRVRRLLDDLVGAHLLQQTQPNRYQFHDLLRAYAADRARSDESPEVARAAIRRVLLWYLGAAAAAARAMAPAAATELDFVQGAGELPVPVFADYAAANSWYFTERANLLAATRLAEELWLYDIAWQLPAVLHDAYAYRNQFDDWLTAATIGLGAARQAANRPGEALLLSSLGTAHSQRGDQHEAARFHRAALTIYRDLGDRLGELRAINQIALGHLQTHELDDALALFEEANSIAVEVGNAYWSALTLGNIAHAYLELERFDDAIATFEDTLAMCRSLQDRFGEGDALGSLGESYRGLGRFAQAKPLLEAILGIARELDNRVWEGYWLVFYGRLQVDLGDPAGALVSYQRAATLQRRIGHRVREAEALDATGVAYRALDRAEDAVNFHRMAVAILRELDERWQLALALDNLATTLDLIDTVEEAEQRWDEARELLRRFSDPRAVRLRTWIDDRLGR